MYFQDIAGIASMSKPKEPTYLFAVCRKRNKGVQFKQSNKSFTIKRKVPHTAKKMLSKARTNIDEIALSTAYVITQDRETTRHQVEKEEQDEIVYMNQEIAHDQVRNSEDEDMLKELEILRREAQIATLRRELIQHELLKNRQDLSQEEELDPEELDKYYRECDREQKAADAVEAAEAAQLAKEARIAELERQRQREIEAAVMANVQREYEEQRRYEIELELQRQCELEAQMVAEVKREYEIRRQHQLEREAAAAAELERRERRYEAAAAELQRRELEHQAAANAELQRRTTRESRANMLGAQEFLWGNTTWNAADIRPKPNAWANASEIRAEYTQKNTQTYTQRRYVPFPQQPQPLPEIREVYATQYAVFVDKNAPRNLPVLPEVLPPFPVQYDLGNGLLLTFEHSQEAEPLWDSTYEEFPDRPVEADVFILPPSVFCNDEEEEDFPRFH